MRLTIIAGSPRASSQSGKIARFAAVVAAENIPDFDNIEVIDLSEVRLPLWEQDPNRPGAAAPTPEWKPISARLAAAHAFVFVVPEWSGMAPAAFKNLLLLCDRNELAHKPALTIGVSSGLGGAYPIAELRASSTKDTRICYIPENVIVRQAAQQLNDSIPQHTSDQSIHRRLIYSLRVLSAYARALDGVRASGVIDLIGFPYGM